MRIRDELLNAKGNNFTALRLVLASAVIYSHCWGLVRGGFDVDDLSRVLGGSVASYAVDAFFVLSGFLVYPSLTRFGPALFAGARLTRLWPGLLLSVALTILGGLAFTTLPATRYLAGAVHYLSNLTFWKAAYTLPGVTCGGVPCDVNGSLWTLPFEVRCYLILGLLGVLGLASKPKVMRAIVAATLAGSFLWDVPAINAIAQSALPRSLFDNLFSLHRLWPLFSLGVLAYIERRRLILSWPMLLGLLVLNLAAVHFGSWFVLQARAAFVAYAVFCCGMLTAKRRAISRGWPDYSYGIYIFAGPVMIALYLLGVRADPYWLSLATFALTLPVAAFSWHVVEKPALDAFRSWRKNGRPAALALPPGRSPAKCEVTVENPLAGVRIESQGRKSEI